MHFSQLGDICGGQTRNCLPFMPREGQHDEQLSSSPKRYASSSNLVPNASAGASESDVELAPESLLVSQVISAGPRSPPWPRRIRPFVTIVTKTPNSLIAICSGWILDGNVAHFCLNHGPVLCHRHRPQAIHQPGLLP